MAGHGDAQKGIIIIILIILIVIIIIIIIVVINMIINKHSPRLVLAMV